MEAKDLVSVRSDSRFDDFLFIAHSRAVESAKREATCSMSDMAIDCGDVMSQVVSARKIDIHHNKPTRSYLR
ncbi:MAG: hypothetical protein OJF51_004596 [Nitrospira sp.]|nr:MAG: hypothetical protein OJF51_004596 [Nitrospira sp.]